jgi:hypothetical protein
MKLSLITSSVLAVGLAIAAAAPASAQEGRVRAGMLNCEGPGQTSFIVGSVTEMRCMFKPEMGRPQWYNARISRIGLDVGVTQANALAWGVFAPTKRIGPGEIAGGYGGVAAGAAVGVGGTANVLVGGSNNSVALQPLSLTGSRGLNAVAGIAHLELTSVVGPGPRRHHRHHRRHHH